MEVYGDVKNLENSIKSRYEEDLKPLKKEADQRIDEIKKATDERLKIMRAQDKIKAEEESKLVYARLVNEEKLKAKREFEETREALVEDVFNEVMKKAGKKAHTKEFLKFIKTSIPKTKEKISAVGDSDYYSSLFKNLKVDKSMVGVKFEVENLIYNFTFDEMMNSKKEQLREAVITALFKEG